MKTIFPLFLALAGFSCGSAALNLQDPATTVENVIRAGLPIVIDLTDDTQSARDAWLGVAAGIDTIVVPSLAGEVPDVNPVLDWIEHVRGVEHASLIDDGVQWGVNLFVLIVGEDWLRQLLDDTETGARVRTTVLAGFQAMSDVIRSALDTTTEPSAAVVGALPEAAIAVGPVELGWPYREVRLP